MNFRKVNSGEDEINYAKAMNLKWENSEIVGCLRKGEQSIARTK